MDIHSEGIVISIKMYYLFYYLTIIYRIFYFLQGINAKYKDDVYNEALYFLEAGRHAYVHDLVVNELAPTAVLKNNIAPLYQLVKKINQDEVPLWELGGNVSIHFVHYIA